MTQDDEEQLYAVIAIARQQQKNIDLAYERVMDTLKTIENRALESEKSLKDLMGRYINRLYEEAAFHQNEQGKRVVVIWCCVTAIFVAGLIACVGVWAFILGEKNERANAPVPAAVQVAPAPTQEGPPKPLPPKKRHRPKPAPSVSPEADLEVAPEGIDPDPRQQPQ